MDSRSIPDLKSSIAECKKLRGGDFDPPELARSERKSLVGKRVSARSERKSLVGKRVSVLWAQGKRYEGTVTKYDASSGKHHVRYDDGDMKSYIMAEKDYWIQRYPPELAQSETLLSTLEERQRQQVGGWEGTVCLAVWRIGGVE